MNEEEAKRLKAYIGGFSQEHNLGYNPKKRQLGNGDWVVILAGKGNYHVWSRDEWLRTYEPAKYQAEQETKEITA